MPSSHRLMSHRLVCLFLLAAILCAQSPRYRQLRRVIDRNTGFAHMTRGVNMYTVYALRSCVDDHDIPLLGDMLRDKDRITRMAVASVLADLGVEGKKVLQARLLAVKDYFDRSTFQEALDDAAKPDYRPILQYPLTNVERSRIRGCP
jgi:hypothetical protein